MLTIFSIPKPFKGQIETIQRNAISSWFLLEPKPEIILLGNEYGTKEIADEFNLRHIAEIATNEYDTPLLDDIFSKAQKSSSSDIMCYVNADIILMEPFLETVEMVKDLERFLMVGLRWKVNIDSEVDFNNDSWETELKNLAKQKGERENYDGGGKDFFVFNRGLLEKIPPFAVGRLHWDSWLVFHSKEIGAYLVDATDVLTVIHQNHDYANLGGIEFSEISDTPEAKRNFEMAGGQDHIWSISDADLIVTVDGLKRARLRNRTLIRWIKTYSLVNPIASSLFKTARCLIDVFRSGKQPSWNK